MHNTYSSVSEMEVNSRIDRLRSSMAETDIDGFLLLSTVETFYYSGIGLESAVFIPKEGEPTHLIKRNINLAHEYSAISNIKDFGRLSQIFTTLKINDGSKIALELDILPFSYVKYLQSTKNVVLTSGSEVLRNNRAIKSNYEVSQISQAASLVDSSFEYCKEIASPEMSEIDLAAKLDKWLLKNGHQGYITTRNFNSALLNYSYVIGKYSSTLNIHFTPISGWGLSLKYPYGPSTQKLGNGPFFVDSCGNHNGYISDTTRTFKFGHFNKGTKEKLDALILIKEYLKRVLKPKADLGAIYAESMSLAKELRIYDNFMGETHDKVAFLGHGIGLELDELPILYSKGSKLSKGNVLACEPKYIEKGKIILGIEDTFAITNSGSRLLSKSPDFFEI
ncbi:MAG: aminopeptidase P family protein [Candidatus Heimdallarchaeota archaeon]|nr:aminopeptidase P family protein [Candidatus Heimdallarchaeota archaeon]